MLKYEQIERVNVRTLRKSSGFTIIELVMVIAIIGILVTVAIVSYNGWQTSLKKNAVKNDITALASSLESARTFDNTYPSSTPSSFNPSNNVTISLYAGSGGSTYCIDAYATNQPSISYYLDSRAKDDGPLVGSCATRPSLEPPTIPTGLAITGTTGTTVTANWNSTTDTTSYILQCASDQAFVYGVQQSTITDSTAGVKSGVVNALTQSSTFYCHVKSLNSKGGSGWSSVASASTDDSYSSLAVATSIEGYWTSAPNGFLLEDGSAVSRTTYAALFAVIGTTYGAGDGTTTFNLPNSKGRTSVNKNASDVEFATIGQFTGSKTEQLTIAQMPSHTHIQDPHNHNNGQANPYVTAGGAGINVYSQNGSAFGYRYNTTTPSPSTVATNQNTGGDEAHNNIQPSIVKLSAIKFAQPDTNAKSLPAGSSINGYWTSAPSGYLLEDGSAVSRTTYATLFAAIGTTYGAGDGSTTFNLPDSRGRASVNISASDTEFDQMGEKPGAKREQLTVNQIPSHTHTQNGHNHNGGFANPYVTDSSFTGLSTSTLAGSAFGFVLRPGPSTTAVNQNTGGDQNHNNIQPAITKLSVIKYTAESGTSTDAVSTGTSVAGYWSSTPAGYLFEDGSAVSRYTYADLFKVIGTTYGAGDGSTTFNIPDSRGRLGVNLNTTDTEFATMGQKYGTKTVTLTIAQLPSHTHVQNTHDHNSGGIVYISDGSFGGTAVTSANGASYGFKISPQPSLVATNQYTGGGQAHNNIMPSIVKRFVIKY